MAEVLSIKLTEINADEEWNCRGHIDPSDVIELAQSIRDQGLIQPVIVAPQEMGKKYKLIAGYRRYMAHRINKVDHIDCIVRLDMQDEKAAKLFNLAENLQRRDLTIMQEAKAVQRLRDLNMTRQQIAGKLNKSDGWVQVRTMLLDMPQEIQVEADAGVLTQPQIRELHTLNNWSADSALAECKKMKAAKLEGRKHKVDKHAQAKATGNKQRVPVRTKVEMFQMIDHMCDCGVGAGLWTRALAWASSEISDKELFESLKEHCRSEGVEYKEFEKPVV